MVKIKTPASTSNLGVGFDTLGLAFNLYNTFEINESDSFHLEGVEDKYNNDDNLFLKAYRMGSGYFGTTKPISVTFNTEVPISRGLGSSSTFIVGGLAAACYMNTKTINKEAIFQIAARMEGHPDNVAPCIFGGLNASSKLDNSFITESLELSKDFKFTCFIPNYEVSTEEARSALPSSYSKEVTINNTSKAILLVKALAKGDLELLKSVARDEIHEPYRKPLIKEFDEVESIIKENNDGVFLISGSGSTCLFIHLDELKDLSKLNSLTYDWQVKSVKPALDGVIIEK